MNISSLNKFKLNFKLYQLMYLFIVISILLIIIFQVFRFKNIIYYEYQGKVIDNNYLEISNLNENEAIKILNTDKIFIDNYLIKEKKLLKEVNNLYNLKIKLPKLYKNNILINIKGVIKEEKLYQFIFRIMKGE